MILNYLQLPLVNTSISETVDISDEHGVLKNLHKHLLDYATEFVQERENVILVRVVSK